MNRATQYRNWILAIPRKAANAALALAILLGLAISLSPSAQAQLYTETVLHSFAGPPDGALPNAAFVGDGLGNLYGTTVEGGTFNYGAVFELDAHGNETVLYSFPGPAGPQAGLIRDSQGNLYGTTGGGGSFNSGTVFKVDANGNETVLYSFTGTGADGATPYAGLVRDAQGNLYGTTSSGGAYNHGTVFKLDVNGNETVLHTFTGADGATPYAGLVRDAQGNLYGTTSNGGAYNHGTVFTLDVNGNETVLHSFTGTGGDGAYVYAGLVRDAQGNLYGTTYFGGDLSQCSGSGCGTVFKLDATGNETVLFSFTGTNGAYPQAGLVRDTQGNLYGATLEGGGSNHGMVFKLDRSGKESVLYSFTETGGDGAAPGATLMRDAQGNLYGTTNWGGLGGINGHGTVFKLTHPTPTTITLTSSLSPSTYGQTVTFSAMVASALGPPPNGETVTFMKGTTVLGTGSLSGGSASFTTSTLKTGTYSITAAYGGDANFAASKSKVTQIVSKATTTTTLSSSQNPSNLGQSVTFTASVTPQFTGTVTATVTFYDGTTALKSSSISGGVAKFTTSTLTHGAHTITATYNGNVNFDSSSSSAVTQTVN